jgi:hypothetical protein
LGGEAAVKAWILLFLAIFSWPFLGVLDLPTIFPGVPLFPAAVFLFWAVLVYVLSAARLAGMDNKNFSEIMKLHGVTLEAFKKYPPT